MSHLVIVESPAKAKTIEKYLGKSYKVKASMGHLRDLPRSKMGVDIEGGFVPDYKPIKGKESMIRELKKAADQSESVYLATDPDREGEAISWHLKELLGLSEEKARRVTFNEITKNVVQESIRHPRAIDENLVDAQQARRLLDRIVGYKLSPFLWKKVRTGLSAGRVQSVATRIVVDREEEIRAFTPEEYWSLDVRLTRPDSDGEGFTAHLTGDENGKISIKNQEQTQQIADAVKNAPFTVKSIKRGSRKRSPAPPFTTSTLQQEASRKLNMTARRTMSIAQQLYEGVEVSGQELTGLITYMRTDSLRLSEEAVGEARQFITGRYGAQYCPKQPRRYKSGGGAQDAHEAIRPVNVNLTPEDVKNDLRPEQYRLYKIIWDRFVACQMENALYDTLGIDIESGGYLFRASNTAVKFPGFMAVYVEGRDDDDEEKEEALPDLTEGEKLKLLEMLPGQHFTQPPPRYTEASLIKTMEEKGVGRPSTYAPTISTILYREYVRKDGKALIPTPLGEVVTGLMKDKFKDIINIEFTAGLEQSLDEIGEGHKQWKQMLAEFYSEFAGQLEKAEKDLDGSRIKIPEEPTDIVCELCGRNMVIKYGRFGRFLACPGFPDCKNTKPLAEQTPGECPKCGGMILKKKSQKGYTYYGCTNHPKCDFMTWDVPTAERCPECGNTIFKLSGRGQTKTFCINENCPLFVPEDKRGYKRRYTAKKGEDGAQAETAAGEAKTTKTAKKKKTGTRTKKKPVAKKTAAKKAATKKPVAKKTPGSKSND